MKKAGLEIHADLKALRRELKTAVGDFKQFNTDALKAATGVGTMEKSTRRTEKALNDVGKTATNTGFAFGGLFKQFTAATVVGNAVTGFFFRVTAAVSDFARGIIKASSDLTELDSKARVVFNESFPQVQKQVRSIAAEVGRASSTILQFATDMGAVISAFGITGPLLDQMSTQFAKLAVDMASFHNTADEEAFAALRSGITGETEPLKRFGIVLTDTNLQLFAFEKGIKTKVLAMNQAQKTALRYAFIMDKTALAQGDAARTADTYANESRRLGGEIKTLQEQLGKAVTPGLAKGLSVVSSAIQDTRIFISLLTQDIKALFAMLNVDVSGTSIGKMLKEGVSSAVNAVNPLFGAFLRSGKTPAQKAIEKRIAEVKAGEVSATPELIDPLANFNSLGGGIGGTGGGAGDALKKVQEAEDDLIQALGDQAKANLDNLRLRREDLMLRQKLGILTRDEEKELGRINNRLEFADDKIQDMVKSWEDNQRAIEDSQKKLQDYRKELKEMAGELADSLKDVDDKVAKSRKEKIVELLKEQNQIREQVSGAVGMTGDMSYRLGEIDAQLAGATPEEIEAARMIAGTANQPGMNDLAQISADGEDEKAKLMEEEKTKRQDILVLIEYERNRVRDLSKESQKAEQEISNALSDRATTTTATYKILEEATKIHVGTMITELDKLAKKYKQVGISPGTIPMPSASGSAGGTVSNTTTQEINVNQNNYGDAATTASDARGINWTLRKFT